MNRIDRFCIRMRMMLVFLCRNGFSCVGLKVERVQNVQKKQIFELLNVLNHFQPSGHSLVSEFKLDASIKTNQKREDLSILPSSIFQ